MKKYTGQESDAIRKRREEREEYERQLREYERQRQAEERKSEAREAAVDVGIHAAAHAIGGFLGGVAAVIFKPTKLGDGEKSRLPPVPRPKSP
jgi:hypothetical protein